MVRFGSVTAWCRGTSFARWENSGFLVFAIRKLTGVRNSTRSQQWSSPKNWAINFGGFAITVLVHYRHGIAALGQRGYRSAESQVDTENYLRRTCHGGRRHRARRRVGRRRDPNTRHKDRWRLDLNGSKMFITNGVYGDLYFVVAKSGEGRRRSREVTMFILEKGTEGFMLHAPSRKWVWQLDTAELVFDNCFVPNEHVLGDVHRGFYAIMQNFRTNGWSSAPNPWARRRKRSKSHSTT